MSSKFADLLADFAKDPKKETEGVWMTHGRCRLRIARAHRNNVNFQKMMEKEMRPYQWAIDRGNFAAIKDAAADVLQVVYAKTILLEIQKLDGTSLDYTWEDGVDMFRQSPDFWDKVFAFASTDTNYSPDAIEDDAKN
jgi:hypothetical protein